MRCISLKLDFISRLIEQNVFKQEVDLFTNNDEYKKMYQDQGNEFWTKYAISSREILLKKYSINVDIVFIEFLTAITNKYESIEAFIESYHEQYLDYKSSLGSKPPKFTDLEIKQIKCAVKISAGFIRMLKLWKLGSETNKIEWEIPDYSLHTAGQFEKCLSSFYTIKQLEELFKTLSNKNAKIFWLEGLKAKSAIKKEDKAMLKRKVPAGKFRKAKNVAKMDVSQKPKERQEEKEEIEIITNYKKTTLLWLSTASIPPRLRQNLNVRGVFEILRDSSNLSSYFWKVFEIALTPLLEPKYHSINIQDLVTSNARHGVSTWSTWVNETFGPNLLTVIHILAPSARNPEEMSLQGKEEWKKKMDSIVKAVASVTEMDSSPKYEDNAKKALDFLLEPTILIQLPSNLSLLHQWLAAAYVEVLLFEKNSMELHFWPLPSDLIKPAAKLLEMVRKLKENIILGFTILFQLVMGRQKETTYEKWILEEVVLPSLEILQFLITGKAYSILRSIKKLAWSKPQDFQKDWLYIADHVYTISDPDLLKYSTNFPYSDIFWDSVNPILYFLVGTPEKLKTGSIINNLHKKQNKSQSQNSYEQNKNLSLSSKILVKRFEIECRDVTYTPDHILETGISTIKEVIIDTGRAPNLEWDDLSSDLIDDFDWVNKPCIEIKLAIALRRRQASLFASENEDSVMARIIRLGLEISERELLISLAFYINRADSRNPVAIKLDKSTPMEIHNMMKLLEEVEGNKRDKKWLWSQFPEEWKKPVNPNEEELDFKSGIESIVQTCENRIGRIVLNSAEKGLEKLGDKFPYWQTVQYILPSIVAEFVQETSNPYAEKLNTESVTKMPYGTQNKMLQKVMKQHPMATDSAINSLKFIDGLLKSYEMKYTNWISSSKNCELLPIDEYILNMNELNELKACIDYYKEMFKAYSYAFIKPELEKSYCYEIINTITEWCKYDNNSTEVFFFLMKWNIKTYNFIKNFYDTSIKSWEVPLPDGPICVPDLSQIYLEEAIVLVLINAIHASAISDESVQADLVKMNHAAKRSSLYEWRCKFMEYITNDSDDGTEVATECLFQRVILSSMYESIREYVKKKGTINMRFIHLYPLKPSQIPIALTFCEEGKIKSLDKLLPLLVNPETPLYPNLEYTYEGTKVKGELGKECIEGIRRCNNCTQMEIKKGSYRTCLKCIEDKYPEVHYYCSKKCEDGYWKKKHKAQHVDHMLGIP